MIDVIPSPAYVAAFRIDGTVQAQDYDEMFPQIEEKLRIYDEIGIFVDLENFEDMTGGAIRRDIKYGIDKLAEFHRFRRAAIATDMQWFKTATEMAASLFPQIEAKVFPSDKKDDALSWVSGFEARSVTM